MVLFYNVAQPQNIKPSYSPFDQVDFLVKMPVGREIKNGSFRISGTLNVSVNDGTEERKLKATDGVFLNQYCGVHSLFRSFTESVNDQTVENIAYYPRWVGMKRQAINSQLQTYSSADNIIELCGLGGNKVLAGDSTGNCYFSFKPQIALNKSNQNLPQSKFVQMRIMTQLASAFEAFYTVPQTTPGTPAITNITYSISDLQLSWYETAQTSAGDVVLNTCYLNKQTVVSNHTNLNIFAPNVYDAISVSFIKQSDLNKLLTDNNDCYLINQIERVEFTLNGTDGPISYPLTSYQDYLLNYKKSLMAGEKNSFSQRLLNSGKVFGLGCSFQTSVNDKLGINIDVNNAVDMSLAKYDAYIYVNGYLTM